MRKSSTHEYRQAYNAQAIVDADGSALILNTNVLSTSNDRQEFDAHIGHLCHSVGKPSTLLADAGYAGEQIIAALEARNIEHSLLFRINKPSALMISSHLKRSPNHHLK